MKKLIILIAVLLSVSSLGFAQSFNEAMTYAGNGMLLQKYRLKVIAENVANVSTHMTDTGEPYRKKYVVIRSDGKGPMAVGVRESQAPFGKVYDPSHVYTGKDGYLRLPNFELNEEMVNLAYTNLLYEANTTVFKSSRQMFQNTMELLK
jgi:flagellar basal-body rod protein FlgC